MSGRALVVGVGMTPFRGFRTDANLRDMAAEAAREALRDAGAGPDKIDLTVVACESDHFNRQLSPGPILQDAVGLAGKPVLRVEGGGATGALAVQTAAAAVASGRVRSALALGAETNGRGVDRPTAVEIMAMSADLEWETPVFGTFAAPYALMIVEHMRRYGTTPDQFARIAVKNRAAALHNPHAHKGMTLTVPQVRSSPPLAGPYRLYDASPLSDGAAAAVLADREWAQEHSANFRHRPPVQVRGAGCATDHPRLADRPPEMFPHFAAKRRAAQQAYREAGLDDPSRQIDVAEVYDSFSGAELQAYEDLGWCAAGEGGRAAEEGRFGLDGAPAVNTSGGLLGRGSAVGATGIAQAVEVVSQLRGEVPAPRAVAGARIGITDTHAGVGSLCAVNVFGRAA